MDRLTGSVEAFPRQAEGSARSGSSLAAVCSGASGDDGREPVLHRPGPRLVESAEILAECLHPGCFDFGHRGRGWRFWEASGA